MESHRAETYGLLGREFLGSAETFCETDDAGCVLECLKPAEGLEEVAAKGEGPMTIHQDDVALDDVGTENLRKVLCARGGVRRGGDRAEREYDLGQDQALERAVREREGDCVGGVGMKNRVHVGPLVVAGQVHPELGRWASLATQLLSLAVDNDQVILGEKAFVAPSARTKEAVGAQTYREVSVESNEEVPFVHRVGEANQFPTQRVLVHVAKVSASEDPGCGFCAPRWRRAKGLSLGVMDALRQRGAFAG